MAPLDPHGSAAYSIMFSVFSYAFISLINIIVGLICQVHTTHLSFRLVGFNHQHSPLSSFLRISFGGDIIHSIVSALVQFIHIPVIGKHYIHVHTSTGKLQRVISLNHEKDMHIRLSFVAEYKWIQNKRGITFKTDDCVWESIKNALMSQLKIL